VCCLCGCVFVFVLFVRKCEICVYRLVSSVVWLCFCVGVGVCGVFGCGVCGCVCGACVLCGSCV